MSGALAKEKAAAAKEVGKLKKLLASIKKFFAKEFLWILFVALSALPIAFIMEYILETYIPEEIAIKIKENLKENLKDKSLLTGTYILSVAGIYFTRAIIGAIAVTVKKPES